AITSQPQKAGFPLTLELTCPALPKRSWLKISQVRTLSVARLQRKIGRATDDEIEEAVEGLNEILSDT
ncbi:MAG: type II toxin-antitoxin system PemK/MazF family toxin, partial [Acidobacteria bacterium]